jgi:DNA-3-methyladenine glycosylase II
MEIQTFNQANFCRLCAKLARHDADLQQILQCHGLPPLWSRSPNFATLVHIILEQQVSLASAQAAVRRLKQKIGRITPLKVLALSDAHMKACSFSRQKTIYARHLAEAVLFGRLCFKRLVTAPDEQVREELRHIKGIGDWSVDVFLMMALHRADCFPTGDIALLKSIRDVKGLPAHTRKEEILLIAEQWRPYRTIAAYLLWWAYMRKRKIKF